MQPLTRLASRLGKNICTALPSWRSELVSLKYIPCKVLTPQRQQRRYGHVGGERWDQDVSLLDPFLGRWIENRKENYSRYLSAAGVPRSMQGSLLNTKTEITYRRIGEEWEVETRNVGSPYRNSYTFQFWDERDYVLFTGLPMRSVANQDGKTIYEKHDSWTGMTIIIITEVIGDQLVVTSTLDGVTAKVFYDRAA